MWKWIFGIAAVPVGLLAVSAGIGVILPREHVAEAEIQLPAPPARVAAMIRDVEGQPRWRSGVTAVDVLERRPDGVRYVEHSGGEAITFDFVEERNGERFRSTIADHDLPFGGFWTISLLPEGGGTRVRIREEGHVGNPIFRFISTLFLGHEKTMRTYLADLERAVGS